jgi:drug/metabolite transporter (DMT)-like permease
MPTIKDLFLFIIMGLCGSVANLLLTQSYRLAEASLVTPIKYLSLVYAITFGFIIWGEVPKPLMLAGALLVILSSLIIFIREKKLKKEIVIPRS